MRVCFCGAELGRSIRGMVVAAVLLSMVGCGAGDDDDKFKGPRGSVTGKVTYKGAPVPANSSIVFMSKEGGYSAGAQINDKGEYTLKYNGKNVMPGVLYLVQVGPPPAPVAAMDPSKASADMQKKAATPFPEKYLATATSGLEFTVKAGANKADFDLVD